MNITLHFLDKNIVTELQQKFQGYNDFCRVDADKGTITFLGSRAEPKRGGGTTYTAGAYKSGAQQAGAFAVTFPTESLRNDFVRIAKFQNFSDELGDAADIDNSHAGQEKAVYFLKKVLPYENIPANADQTGSVGHIKFTFDNEDKLRVIQAWVEKNKPKLDFIIVNLSKKMLLVSASKGNGTSGAYKTATADEYGINFPEGTLRNEFQNFISTEQLKTEGSSKGLYCTPEMQDSQPVLKATAAVRQQNFPQQNVSQPSTSTFGGMISSLFSPSDKVKKITKFPKFKNDQYIKAKLEVKTNQLIFDFESSDEQYKLTKEQLKFVKEHFMYQLQGLLAGQQYSLKLDSNNKVILEMDFTQGESYQETINKSLYFGTSQAITSSFLSLKNPLAPQVANTLKFIEKALFSQEYGDSHPLISHDEKGLKKGNHDNTINPARVAQWPFVANPPQVAADDRILFYEALGEQYDGLQGLGPSTINIPRLAIEFPSVEARNKFLNEDRAFGLPCTVVDAHPRTVYIEPLESNASNYQTGQRSVIAPINPQNLGPCGVYFSRGSGEGFEFRLEFPNKADRKAFIEKMGTIQTTNSDRTIESYVTDSNDKETSTVSLLHDCFRTVESFSPALGKSRQVSSFEGYYSTYNKGNKKASSVVTTTPMSTSSNAVSAPVAPKNEFKLIIRYSDDAVFAQIKQFVKNNIQIKKFISINEIDKAIVINAAPQKGEAGAYIATGKESSINFPSEALRKEFQTLSLLRPSMNADDVDADIVRQSETQKSAIYFNPNKYANNNNKAEISISYKTVSSILREIIDEHCIDPVTMDVVSNPVILSTGHTYEKETIDRVDKTTKKCPNTNLPYSSRVTNKSLQALLVIINATRSEVPDAVKFEEIKKLLLKPEYSVNTQDHMLRNVIQAFKQKEAEMQEIVKREAVVQTEASLYYIPSSSTQAKQQTPNSAPSTSVARQSSTTANAPNFLDQSWLLTEQQRANGNDAQVKALYTNFWNNIRQQHQSISFETIQNFLKLLKTFENSLDSITRPMKKELGVMADQGRLELIQRLATLFEQESNENILKEIRRVIAEVYIGAQNYNIVDSTYAPISKRMDAKIYPTLNQPQPPQTSVASSSPVVSNSPARATMDSNNATSSNVPVRQAQKDVLTLLNPSQQLEKFVRDNQQTVGAFMRIEESSLREGNTKKIIVTASQYDAQSKQTTAYGVYITTDSIATVFPTEALAKTFMNIVSKNEGLVCRAQYESQKQSVYMKRASDNASSVTVTTGDAAATIDLSKSRDAGKKREEEAVRVKQEEERKKREEEARKQEEERKKREEENRKQEEERKKREEENRRQEERKKQEQEDRKREEERKKREQEDRKREEERKKQEQEDRKREEERKKREQEDRKREEERKKQEQEDRKREEERKKHEQGTSSSSRASYYPSGAYSSASHMRVSPPNPEQLKSLIQNAISAYLLRCETAKGGFAKLAHKDGITRAEEILGKFGTSDFDALSVQRNLLDSFEKGKINGRSGLNDALIFMFNKHQENPNYQYDGKSDFAHSLTSREAAVDFLKKNILEPFTNNISYYRQSYNLERGDARSNPRWDGRSGGDVGGSNLRRDGQSDGNAGRDNPRWDDRNSGYDDGNSSGKKDRFISRVRSNS